MLFNEVYKKFTWKFFLENYKANLANCSDKYLRILNKQGKIFFDSDGTVLINVDNPDSLKNYVMYNYEFIAYLNAVSLNVIETKNNNLFSEDGVASISNEFEEYVNMLSDNSFELNEKKLNNRHQEYKENKGKVGYSLPNDMNFETEREKSAAIFADQIASKENVADFLEYQQLEHIFESMQKPQYALELYKLGLEIYDTVKKQCLPYISGEIIDVRKARGLCPACGGAYKGFFKKVCVRCGMTKGSF